MQLVASVIEVFHNHWIFCNFTSSNQVLTQYTLHMRDTHPDENGVQVSDFEWCLTDNAETQERGRFFLIILNLATIEVRERLYFLRLPPPSLCR